MSKQYSIDLPLPKKLVDFDSEQLEVTLIASHTNRIINFRKYFSSEFMKQLKSWTTPYQRPVLVHHDDMTDQIGRVTEQYYGNKAYLTQVLGTDIQFPQDQDGAIALKAYITDKDAINKIKNGAYTTVSIGFMQDELICSYCGQQVGECEHIPGTKIDGELVYSIPRGITFQEISFVNKPADDYAGIVNIRPVDAETATRVVNVQPIAGQYNAIVNPAEANQAPEFAYANSNNAGYHISDGLEQQTLYVDSQQQRGCIIHIDNESEYQVNCKEASNMDEALDSKYKSELQEATKQLQAVIAERDKLQATVQKLTDMLKSELVGKVVNKKMLLLEQDDEETEQKLTSEYSKMSIDQLIVLDNEYSGLVDSLFDELEESCENCNKDLEPDLTTGEGPQKVSSNQTQQSKEEESKTEGQNLTEPKSVEPKSADQANDSLSNQGIKKLESPLGTTVLDQFDSVKKILGLK